MLTLLTDVLKEVLVKITGIGSLNMPIVQVAPFTIELNSRGWRSRKRFTGISMSGLVNPRAVDNLSHFSKYWANAVIGSEFYQQTFVEKRVVRASKSIRSDGRHTTGSGTGSV